ncbi:FHA domain-containing protein [Microbacterium sp. C7(2022)]|uniref:FHA domain-containing protein n=1 Tax=Microbacterium sp. C7(2022) TaxID=2992759 RepID=UPI00237BF173|nr:FHA domain-containing protein [Microbacterium sp. C7(2022)]MDE0545149.1 FHA domain-containing protein [Microbacterium sp. C7(2022)]
MTAHYAPGAHPVAVTPHGFVMLSPESSASLVARVWHDVAAGRGLPAVLEALTGAYGTSLAAIPPFAVVLRESDSWRIAVRGDIAVEVESAGGAELLSGAGVTTWSERVLGSASRVTVSAATADAPSELPIDAGVVLVSKIQWVPDAAAEPDPEPNADADADRAEVAPAPPVIGPPVPGLVPHGFSAAEPVSPRPPLPPRQASVPSQPAGAASIPPSAAPGIIDSAAVLALSDTLLPQETTFTVGDEEHDEAASDGSAVDDDFDATEISERSGSAANTPNTPNTPADDDVAEATVMRAGVEGAAARTPRPAPALGDHDGQTVSLAEARAARQRAAGGGAASDLPASSGSAAGSTEPPPLAPPRLPSPGQLRVSTGQVVPLNRTVVFGRRPRSTRITGTDLPHLITVESPQQDISRSHLEVRVEGGSIVATDLDTTNGTLLVRSGADPVRLHPHEATVVVHGDILDLGDGVTVTVEEDA